MKKVHHLCICEAVKAAWNCLSATFLHIIIRHMTTEPQCVFVYLLVGLMKVKEMSWFQNGSFSDMDSVPTRAFRLGLSDRSLTWLVLAPITAG